MSSEKSEERLKRLIEEARREKAQKIKNEAVVRQSQERWTLRKADKLLDNVQRKIEESMGIDDQ